MAYPEAEELVDWEELNKVLKENKGSLEFQTADKYGKKNSQAPTQQNENPSSKLITESTDSHTTNAVKLKNLSSATIAATLESQLQLVPKGIQTNKKQHFSLRDENLPLDSSKSQVEQGEANQVERDGSQNLPLDNTKSLVQQGEESQHVDSETNAKFLPLDNTSNIVEQGEETQVMKAKFLPLDSSKSQGEQGEEKTKIDQFQTELHAIKNRVRVLERKKTLAEKKYGEGSKQADKFEYELKFYRDALNKLTTTQNEDDEEVLFIRRVVLRRKGKEIAKNIRQALTIQYSSVKVAVDQLIAKNSLTIKVGKQSYQLKRLKLLKKKNIEKSENLLTDFLSNITRGSRDQGGSWRVKPVVCSPKPCRGCPHYYVQYRWYEGGKQREKVIGKATVVIGRHAIC